NPDPRGGVPEGQLFLLGRNVTTNAAGQASFSVPLPASVTPGQLITATATSLTADPSSPAGSANVGNTSEFSAAVAVSLPPPPCCRPATPPPRAPPRSAHGRLESGAPRPRRAPPGGALTECQRKTPAPLCSPPFVPRGDETMQRLVRATFHFASTSAITRSSS